MKEMIGILHPFHLKQNFYIYENGNQIAQMETTVENLNEDILNFVKKYDVQKINLEGPEQYNNGLVKKLKEAELARYNKNTLEINVTKRRKR